jgi:RHS repeat-associated protein
MVVEYVYDAWGKLLEMTGALANTIGALNPFRYRGYYYDAETGFYYCIARYYDPEICRWINADNQIAGVGGDVLGYNQFTYCFNNPVNLQDETGSWPKLNKLVKGALLLTIGVLAVAAAVVAPPVCSVLVTVGYAALAIGGTGATVLGASEVYESFTDKNPIKEAVGEPTYETIKAGSLALITVGTAIVETSSTPSHTKTSKGSTRRTEPNDLIEQLAMEQVKSNPSAGKILTKISLNDTRWPSSEGWVKMQQIVSTTKGEIIIHYVYNQKINIYDDFKFKS